MKKVFFVELGANDGIKQSNTFYFEKNLSWRGILIEPIKIKYLKCLKFRSSKIIFITMHVLDLILKMNKLR